MLMSKDRLWSLALLALVAGIPLLYLGSCALEHLSIDECLDAGGRWNYGAGECEGARQ
jgi:hypothetical protein